LIQQCASPFNRYAGSVFNDLFAYYDSEKGMIDSLTTVFPAFI